MNFPPLLLSLLESRHQELDLGVFVFSSTVRVCNHSFLPQLINSSSVVIDLGANDGDFAQEMIERYGCRVVSAEPVQELIDRIAPHPLLQVYPVAVGGLNQRVNVNVFASRCASVLGAISPGERATAQSVEMVTLAELLRRAGVDRMDLLKFDIEGAEIDVFNSCSDAELQSATQITVEFHDFIYSEQAPAVSSIRERMSDIGFWVLPFSMDNTDVLFLNKASGIGAAEITYLRSIARFGKGIARRIRRMAS